MDAILAGLNAQQKCAVTSSADVLQVLAPPGSGKTKTLTARVAHLLAHRGLKPWNIVVCTFTIKAAREMKERIRAMVGDNLEAKLILGTFHSIARRFLVTYGHFIDIDRNFGIADTSDTTAILKRIIKRRSYSVEPSVARSRISGLKAKSISCEQHAAAQKGAEQQEFACLYAEYEETLKASNLLDYDDLLLRCAELLRTHPECVSNIEAVLIDEFQDTNHVQYDLMSLFAQKQQNITIVGDPDQSIYGFRSAEIKNLSRMQRQYPDTLVIILEENYRSSAAILYSALEVIEQDEARPAKKLLPTHGAGERPVLRRLPSAAAEAAWIVAEIKRAKALTGHLLSYTDFAILLRSASLSRQIETALGKAGIPYRMVGGHKFFDRVEVKLILDYLRVINQPDHSDALVRIINVPSRKIGEITIKGLLEEAEAEKITLWTLILDTAQGRRRPKVKLSAQAQKGLETFVNIILTSRKKLTEPEEASTSLTDLISHIFRKISFEDYLKKTYPDEFENRWANVEELIAQATDVATSLANGEVPTEETLPEIEGVEQRKMLAAEDILNRFLANVALATDTQTGGEAVKVEQVTISTIHAAKGLEWPVVFIPAAYQGSIPHSRAEDTDEERRLLYVGMTRAQAMLYLSCPTKNSQREETILSPFLSLPKTLALFARRGTTFGHSVAQALAKILRRICPPLDFIDQCRGTLERLEDDMWPENGEEIKPESSYSEYNHYSSDRTYSSFSAPYSRLEKKQPAAGIATSMTMQHTYSVASSTLSSGFVSAGACMKEIEAQAEATAAEREKNTLKRQAAPQGTAPRGLKRQMSGQGSIASFFGKPKPAEAASVPKVQSKPLKMTTTAFQRASVPLNDISNFAIAAPPTVPETLPLPGVGHKVRNMSTLGRPRSTTPADDKKRLTRHVLLSSSPVKPELDSTNDKPRATDAPITSASSCFRPASTFHTTSVSQLTNKAPGPRKTLGVRRTIQGWSSRVNQPFNAPGRPK